MTASRSRMGSHDHQICVCMQRVSCGSPSRHASARRRRGAPAQRRTGCVTTFAGAYRADQVPAPRGPEFVASQQEESATGALKAKHRERDLVQHLSGFARGFGTRPASPGASHATSCTRDRSARPTAGVRAVQERSAAGVPYRHGLLIDTARTTRPGARAGVRMASRSDRERARRRGFRISFSFDRAAKNLSKVLDAFHRARRIPRAYTAVFSSRNRSRSMCERALARESFVSS
jgi:hypothetical protein